MDPKTQTRLSKFMSLVLRHQPGSIGLELDGGGWAEIDQLVARSRAHGVDLSREAIERITATSPKQRFAISDDRQRVRASQGHSIGVELGHAPSVPPDRLYHGTVEASLAGIRADGLSRMARDHVHLSPDTATARVVAMRRGRPVVLVIAAGAMHRDGHVFYRSQNGVWLVERVPPAYIEFPGP
ncbi:MAG TPA: RNA 2'-phosphotransferase [Kofleriaceae bacterium]|nr:RNA 2'-phosphotransferase [Kofleriaceae bacterium]